MAETRKPDTDVHVPCEVCMKEIPISEARSEEATDYVVHFCGLECYAKWRQRERKGNDKKNLT